jgi:LacI family transcriptional regulator
MKSVSIKTVAQKAGVSHNTVCLALRGDDRVASGTRARVMRAVKELGYRPNLLARAVVTGRSLMLGLSIPRLDFSYMPRLCEAIQETAFENGYGVLTRSHHNDPEKMPDVVQYFVDRRVDGVITHCPVPGVDPAVWEPLEQFNVSTVFLSFGHEQLPGLVLDVLPGAAGEIAVRKFVELGHSSIGYAGPVEGFFEETRLNGVRRALAEQKLADPPVFLGAQSLDGGREAARQFLKLRDRPTAIAAFDDQVALGFILEASTAGIRVPEDVAIIGVDDLLIAQASRPALSTLKAPAEEIGRAAVLAAMSTDPAPSGQHTFDWQFVDRESHGRHVTEAIPRRADSSRRSGGGSRERNDQ